MIKRLLPLAFFIYVQLGSIFCYGQTELSTITGSGNVSAEKKKVPIIEKPAFDKTITQDITYAITGENVPTAGVKVDLTKAMGTISGFVHNPRGVDFTLDIDLGITEGTAALFDSHKNLHSNFRLTAGLVLIPRQSSAWMDSSSANLIRTSRLTYTRYLIKNRSDSLLCIALIVKGHNLEAIDKNGDTIVVSMQKLVDTSKKYKKDSLIKQTLQKADAIGEKLDSDSTVLTIEQRKLIKELLKKYFPAELQRNNIVEMYGTLSTIRGNVRIDLLINDLIKALNVLVAIPEDNTSYQVKLASSYWNVKNLYWWTFSPFIQRQGFSLFEQTLLTRTDTSSVTYGLGGRFNYIRNWRNGFFYINGGMDVFRANNLSDFKKVEYIEQDSIVRNSTKYIFSESTGVSYTSEKLDHEVGYRFLIESFVFLSKKNFVPGLYGRFDFTFSKAYRNDKVASFEFALPFNINSPDKTKSVVSIAPYIRFENLKAEEKPEIENEVRRDDFTMGLKIGLPIKLASR